MRLSGFLSDSGANRVKFALGVVLWGAALAAVAGLLLARPLSATGILGATCTGQDILGATLLAGRRLLLPVLLGAMIPILLGLALGAYAGYFRFSLLSRAIEYAMGFLEAMPKLVLVMIAAVIVETDALYLYKVVPFMGLTFTPIIYDHVRKRVEYLQRMNFVETERALGARPSRILFYHILFNNCRSIVSVHGVHLLGQIVLLDAAFDYLGLAQPEHYTWGALFYNSIYDWFLGAEANPWAFLAPLAAIILSVCALTTLSDGLDAILRAPAQEVT
jgi:peptide/nickel transport system permease protein